MTVTPGSTPPVSSVTLPMMLALFPVLMRGRHSRETPPSRLSRRTPMHRQTHKRLQLVAVPAQVSELSIRELYDWQNVKFGYYG